MYGAKNASRKNHLPRVDPVGQQREDEGQHTSGGVVRMVNQTVCHIDDQKSELLQRLDVVARSRRSSPSPDFTRLVSKKLITSP